MSESIPQKLVGAEKAFFFVGEKFVTVKTKKGMVRIRMNLNGPGDVRRFSIDPSLVAKTRQFKTMAALGFHPIDKFSMVYEKRSEKQGVIKVRFFNSIIKELTVNGIPVNNFTLEMEM